MAESDILTLIDKCGEVSAADTLTMITSLRRRARILQQRIWLLPAALGVMTILGTPLLNTKQVIQSCWLMTGTPKPITCIVSHSGKNIIALTSLGTPIRGPISFTGRFPVIWSIGNSTWFWLIGIAASILLSILFQRSSSRLPTFALTYLMAGFVGISVILTSGRMGLSNQLSHLLAVALIICVAAFASRSKILALLAGLSFFLGIALSRRSSELFARLNVWIPPHSISYVAAGLTLVAGAVLLYMRIRSPRFAIDYLSKSEEFKYCQPNYLDQPKGE